MHLEDEIAILSSSIKNWAYLFGAESAESAEKGDSFNKK